MSSALTAARKSVEQLRQEASISRMKVSQAAQELQNYCVTNQRDDPLICGISNADNPFKEKSVCSIL